MNTDSEKGSNILSIFAHLKLKKTILCAMKLSLKLSRLLGTTRKLEQTKHFHGIVPKTVKKGLQPT